MRAAGAVLAAGLGLLPAGPALAHPLGNFTVNHYTGVRIAPDRIEIEYILDLAEIPAFQARQLIDRDGDGQLVPAETEAWRDRQCAQLGAHLRLAVDGRPVVAEPAAGGRLSFPPGVSGLPTLRLECALAARTGDGGTGSRTLTVEDTNDADRIGWREITVTGAGTTVLAADAPDRSVSERLTRYPSGLLATPLEQVSARITYRTAGTAAAADGATAAATPAAPGGDTAPRRPLDGDRLTAALTGFVGRHRLTAPVALAALAAALLLGALHALAPGHGKTMMAAYLLGRRGRPADALTIGLTVTTTHTAGVLVLGLVLSTATALAAERVYPWFGLASGVLLAALGVGLLRRAGHRHRHHEHEHEHRPDPQPAGAVTDARPRTLMAIGFVGGLTPSPSALVILLTAVALQRAWFGVLLVVAYGVGMAAALAGIGLLLSRTHGALVDRATRLSGPLRRVPAGAGALAVLGGLLLAARNAMQI